MNIFVGNLPFNLTDQELNDLFAEFGEVTKAKVINDRETGRSRGFGFVEMGDKAAGKSAIEGLDGKDVKGRPIKVNEARPKA